MARDLVIGAVQTLVSTLMGYAVHITRGDWWDQESARISDHEWWDVVDRDPDLT
jgi:hypothetical protein